MNRFKGNRGFTLLEVLVAVSILAFITASVWSSLFASARAREAVEKRDNFHQRVRLVLDRLSTDLSLAFIVPAARGFTGFRGTSDRVTFSTLAHQQIDPKSKESEEGLVMYFLERDQERPSLYELRRKEEKRLKREFREPDTRALTLLPGVTELKFEYYDGEKFSDEWDHESIETKKKDNIPRAVKIHLKVKDKDDFEHTLYTMVNVQLSRLSAKTFQAATISTGGEAGSPGSEPTPTPTATPATTR